MPNGTVTFKIVPTAVGYNIRRIKPYLKNPMLTMSISNYQLYTSENIHYMLGKSIITGCIIRTLTKIILFWWLLIEYIYFDRNPTFMWSKGTEKGGQKLIILYFPRKLVHVLWLEIPVGLMGRLLVGSCLIYQFPIQIWNVSLYMERRWLQMTGTEVIQKCWPFMSKVH